jgi:serine-type D-Ala-D-Ala carboxypeptidase/endopeptidase
MKLDDPVAKYLPKSAKMPTYKGRQITLLHLATHTSGLPRDPGNLAFKHGDNPFADYTVEKLYAFLSGYKLTRDPGAKYEYSNLGFGLLGHVIALKAGTNYESLVVEQICRPLHMGSTQIILSPELKARFARGHDQVGHAAPSFDFDLQNPLVGAGALRSTANDLLKYVSANLGLTPSSLTPLLEKTHASHLHQTADVDLGLAWMISHDLQGAKVCHHGGITAGYYTFVGLDEARRRGVVVLCNSRDEVGFSLGKVLLESEWQSNRRLNETGISGPAVDSCVGQYRLSPTVALGMLIMRLLLANASKALICIPAGFGAAMLAFLLWRARCVRQRWVILGCTAFAGGLLAVISGWYRVACFAIFSIPA